MIDVGERLRGPLPGPTVLLFGSLALAFDEVAFAQVRKAVVDNEDSNWVLGTIAEFPQIWKSLTASNPSLKIPTGLEQLEDLSDAFRTGRPLETPFPLPNKLLIPLVIVSHLTQYATFLRDSTEGQQTDPFSTSKSDKETLGLCTGLLSAFAISSTSDREQFKKYAAVAVRLAMLVGTVVDAQDAATEPSKSLSAAWNSSEGAEELQRIVRSIPGTYISVNYDENRATVTTKAAAVSNLQQQLRDGGLIASEVGLYGRFHANVNAEVLKSLLKFVDAHVEFQFPDGSSGLAIPTRSNRGGDLITQGPLHHHALQSILTEPPQWFQTVSALRDSTLKNKDSCIVSFGPERTVPPSLLRSLNPQVFHVADLDSTSSHFEAFSQKDLRTFSDNDVAVVGMSIKVAGAETLDDFWDLLVSAKSQHKEVPKERFSFETAFRDVDPKRKWYGNFIENHDKFDHKFFKKSPRESSTMDPQQRHFLQCAYQAVEQSGYFHLAERDSRIGCFVGVCSRDYDCNIACHAPNAFSATGNLQSFISGKVSHYFGWTGPGLTIDTACSSSAVAIHQACRAIVTGECIGALAGGTNVVTNPLWFQNLAGASFLSTTGQCKPFDAKADGYCRGEGVAAVFLKKLSAAVADGDQILGVVAGTGVQQNENCTPIFVPNAPSLSDLFRGVTKQARLKPSQISVVEAHGTGTGVGDPAEYDGIRQVLGGPASGRDENLLLGSVKGLIGHTEATSGVVSLVKIMLMIQKGMIPPQPSHTSINPAIGATPADKMIIPLSLKTWNAEFRAALINNYGASGSNASMVLTQSPFASTSTAKEITGALAGSKYPFWVAGLDDQSLRRYAKVFRKFLNNKSYSAMELSLPNVSFNLARQSNRSLEKAILFSVRSIEELDQKLASIEKGDTSVASIARPENKPVVFCFGGQVSTSVGLDQNLYQRTAVLRKHLNSVDAVVRSLGAGSIFPGIFETTPVQDTVQLQTMLFAIQYACARSWIDSGIKPAAVVGHSFGELTALAISQVLSLEDAMKMVANRAAIVRDSWGSEKGAMMAIEADLADVEKLLAESNQKVPNEKPASIACYNGPRSFTLAGSTAAIDAVAATIPSSLRSKRLNVTNSFHCALVDPIVEALEQVGKTLTFRRPMIPVERASEFPIQEKHTAKFVADHMRYPVYFNHAIQRLAKQFPSAVFLEAGSNSTITSMAGRALGNPSSSHFQAINITNSDKAWDNLVDATLNLWKAGIPVQHWAHQAAQTREHSPLLLPPYQFEQASHWVDFKVPPKVSELPPPQKTEQEEKLPEGLLTFDGYQDSKKRIAKFRINTMIPKYERLIVGHIIAQTASICPATVQLDLVIEALRGLRPDLESAKLEPQVHVVENQSPICVNPARGVWIEVEEESTGGNPSWKFKVFSTDMPQGTTQTLHTTGKVVFCSTEDLTLKLEFARLERLVSHARCVELLQSGDIDEVLSNRNIYRIFAEIVDYGEDYRGLQKLVGCGNQSAGRVEKKYNPETWLDAHLADSFCQVGGVFVNCMTDRPSSDMYIANGIEQWIRSPKLRPGDARPDSFHVLASHHPSDKQYLTDVFIFHPKTGVLLEAILGISYVRIPKASMSRLLSRLTVGGAAVASPSEPTKVTMFEAAPTEIVLPQPPHIKTPKAPKSPKASKPPKAKKQPKSNVVTKVKEILVELSGLEMDEVKDDSMLVDLGIDSLMGMEMAHEIEAAFKITLPESELMEIVDMPSLMVCVRKAVGEDAGGSEDVSEQSEDDASSDSDDRSTSASDSSGNPTGLTTPAVDYEKDPYDTLSTCDEEMKLPFSTIMEAFNETKALTDDKIAEYGQTNYFDTIMPLQTDLCIALTLEAFDQLGHQLRDAKPGDKFTRISHPKEHSRLVDYLYQMLEKESHIINVNGDTITRTAVAAPTRSSKEILQDLLARFPDQTTADKLTFYTGSNLAEVLRGKTDGIKLIFGTPEGRDLVSGLYAEWPLNRIFYKQMEDFLERLCSKLDMSEGPLKILEMGAGTGGTTKWLVPLLASLNVPVEYTFTDLAPSFVAAARKRFKQYPFMKFRAHDIEKVPADDLIGTQHIIVASNAVHATHSLRTSGMNIRKALRPDGFLMLLEMTGTLYWVDMIFGLFEGWWFFDDGRTHAVTHELRWEKELQAVGYGHVDWTDGALPENRCEKLIIAMASGERCERLPTPSSSLPIKSLSADLVARQTVVDRYVKNLTEGFSAELGNVSEPRHPRPISDGKTVLVTGATGSLGSHLIAQFAESPDVARVVCLNRRSRSDPQERQKQALIKKGIALSKKATDKLSVFETDMSKPNLGLPVEDYEDLVDNVTDIVHNAWLMNAKWPLRNFETQFQIMKNLLNLSREISLRSALGNKVTFQFISSIATVGHRPIWSGEPIVPEERMTIESVLPTGYGDAKYICELMLDETLHKHPDRFRTMVVRPGQIAGSSTSGYWNPMEHLSFLIKSSQTLKALPDFDGLLSWTPVDEVASTLVDLVFLPEDKTHYPIYHVDNPIRQPWKEMTPILADALNIPHQDIIPFRDWVRRVRDHPRQVEGPEGENPAFLLIDFLDDNFIRMSCGGLLLDTIKVREHSKTLANAGPVSEKVTRQFIKSWKEMGFLSQ
ncbi:uncharacterized protein F4822DRAFT_423774 [Hypoxylon trugodes]|uniref:uncharacterized protein n=1 Tax=Hypoxylon trugodes TaxID=326681 RepID=UPI002190D8D2|nr:uncharacterized protein F4822DRAFT_423774 [Hypoxylon trugodes]KAI1393305.1 hypothetical protein F4822DRAFT_423774 [Hypoxylon trugodes]